MSATVLPHIPGLVTLNSVILGLGRLLTEFELISYGFMKNFRMRMIPQITPMTPNGYVTAQPKAGVLAGIPN